MSVRKTQEQVIAKFIAKHGDRYDYSQVNYVDSETKLTIICRKHGPFEMVSGDHLGGRGCRRCGREVIERSRRLPIEVVKQRIVAAQGLKYIYDLDHYTSGEEIRYLCPTHGWRTQVMRHLLNVGCSQCQIELNLLRRKTPLTFADLQEYVRCDLETGRLYERKSYLRHKAGDEMKYMVDRHSYLGVSINRRKLPVHRVVMAFSLGRLTDPTTVCDHINGIVDDNRAVNLREVPQQQNCCNQKLNVNNKTSVSGVFYIENEGVYVATITHHCIRTYLGRFRTLEAAAAIRKKAEEDRGFHPNHGKTREERAKTT
ncbi:MAG: hypothetical protein QG638_2038 [Pseudomonadota bacterium]|nr:hypothetical protein [Pseudomonadota bacterium]